MRELAERTVRRTRMSGALRQLFTVASLVSLLLATAGLLMWVTSYRLQRTYRFAPTVPPPAQTAPLAGRPGEWRYQWHASFGGGAFQILRLHAGISEIRPAGLTNDSGPLELSGTGQLAGATDFRFAGFRYFDCARKYSTGGGVSYWTFGFCYATVPGWLPVLVLGVPSSLWLLHRRRQARRALAGHCLTCGYDLRASPGRCPECGAAGG